MIIRHLNRNMKEATKSHTYTERKRIPSTGNKGKGLNNGACLECMETNKFRKTERKECFLRMLGIRINIPSPAFPPFVI